MYESISRDIPTKENPKHLEMADKVAQEVFTAMNPKEQMEFIKAFHNSLLQMHDAKMAGLEKQLNIAREEAKIIFNAIANQQP